MSTQLEINLVDSTDEVESKSNSVHSNSADLRWKQLENWWASLTKEWKSLGLIATATTMVLALDNQIYTALYLLSTASILYWIILRQLKPVIGEQRWSIWVFHAVLSSLVTTPAMAQLTDNTNACVNEGILAGLTSFVSSLFSTITFGGIGGGTLSNLICQVIGYVIVALILAFISIIATVAFQIGYQQQPPSVVVNPIFGFLIFAGGATVVITVFLGTGATG